MYRVVNITKSVATRVVKLENLKTETIDDCFDDSAVVSDTNFEFMKCGNSYDYKIKLFGEFVSQPGERVVSLSIINENVCIGKTNFIKVSENSDIYYILQSELKNAVNKGNVLFK